MNDAVSYKIRHTKTGLYLVGAEMDYGATGNYRRQHPAYKAKKIHWGNSLYAKVANGSGVQTFIRWIYEAEPEALKHITIERKKWVQVQEAECDWQEVVSPGMKKKLLKATDPRNIIKIFRKDSV